MRTPRTSAVRAGVPTPVDLGGWRPARGDSPATTVVAGSTPLRTEESTDGLLP